MLRQYAGREMEFTGAVMSCAQAFDSLWAVRINAGEVDVIGYARSEIPVGQEMRGMLVGIRDGERVAVVLDGVRIDGLNPKRTSLQKY